MKRPHDTREATHPTGPAPRFCPGCGKPAPKTPGTSACPFCGDRLVGQGFCPVCERFLRLPIGTTCPKHDLPLEARAPARPHFDDAGRPLKWVTVSQFSDSLAAEAPRIRLEAEGIPTFVEGERMGARSMYHVATGGVKLKVPDSLAADARVILSQTWSATAAELEIDDCNEDDLDDPSPRNGAESGSLLGRVLGEMLLGAIVIVPVVGLLYLLLRSARHQ